MFRFIAPPRGIPPTSGTHQKFRGWYLHSPVVSDPHQHPHRPSNDAISHISNVG